MSTTHSNFRILQLKFFAGVSLCRLVAMTFRDPDNLAVVNLFGGLAGFGGFGVAPPPQTTPPQGKTIMKPPSRGPLTEVPHLLVAIPIS